jgi:hypothetical protein
LVLDANADTENAELEVNVEFLQLVADEEYTDVLIDALVAEG